MTSGWCYLDDKYNQDDDAIRMITSLTPQSAIPVPDFISRQIMLDLVEIVEKGDTGQCAHLVLVR